MLPLKVGVSAFWGGFEVEKVSSLLRRLCTSRRV